LKKPVSRKPAKPRTADIETPTPPTPRAAEKPVQAVHATSKPDPVQTARGDADDGTVTSTRLARGVVPEASAVRGAAAAPGFTPARYARTVKPRYPRKARRAGWEGTTVLKVLVHPDGAPGPVAVDRTSGFDILDSAAVKAVERWRFHPARRGVEVLPSWVRVPVAFKLKEDNR